MRHINGFDVFHLLVITMLAILSNICLGGACIPIWNKEASDIVFSAYVGTDYELYKFNLISREIMQLTNNEFDDIQPQYLH